MVHILISGNVQGVGFRQFIKFNAKKLNIKGWVKNLDTGEVEGMFVGEEKNVKKLIEICKKGPFLAEVIDLSVERIPDIDFDDFKILS